MGSIYARLKNQSIFKYQTVFLARFDEQNDDSQLLNETEFYINLNRNHKITETDVDNFFVRFALEEQIQKQ